MEMSGRKEKEEKMLIISLTFLVGSLFWGGRDIKLFQPTSQNLSSPNIFIFPDLKAFESNAGEMAGKNGPENYHFGRSSKVNVVFMDFLSDFYDNTLKTEVVSAFISFAALLDNLLGVFV